MTALPPLLSELFLQSNSCFLDGVADDVLHGRFHAASVKAHAVRSSALIVHSDNIAMTSSALMDALASEDKHASLSLTEKIREQILSFAR